MERAKFGTKQYVADYGLSNNLAQMGSYGSNERGVEDTLRPSYEGPEVPGCVGGSW